MKLVPGTRLGPYEVVAPIGAGGMGEVYQARDSRLDRSVAIKVLPAALGTNPQLRLRFEREAKAISSLAHPNICVLHDVGREAETDFLVMELLDGETLDARIRKGPMPVEDVLTYAIQIANALGQAHRQGIVHRDLKPSNIMITRSGAKLLDFGLSKTLEGDGPALVDLSGATEHLPITTEGTIVGTFQYMAPEQIEGKPADERTDIFAFGAVIYEMITGQRAFPGKSRTSAIAAILALEPPPIHSLRPLTPAALDRIVAICLRKDPDERWQSMHDLRLELEFTRDQPVDAGAHTPVRSRLGRWIPWALAGLIATGAGIAALLDVRTNHRPVAQWFHVSPPEGTRFEAEDATVAVSPDGRSFVLRFRTGDNPSTLWIRRADGLEMRPLNGTERAYDPFWSWDGSQVGFFTEDKLKRIHASGGPATTIAAGIDGWGGAWAKDGSILVGSPTGAIMRYPPDGGAPQPVTSLNRERKEAGHVRPFLLPDGKHFLYLAQSTDIDLSGIYVAPTAGGTQKRVLDVNTATIHSGRDHLLYFHNGNLYAQKFDLKRLEASGRPFVVADRVSYFRRWNSAGYSASRNGVLAYHLSGAETEPRIVAFTRDGTLENLGELYGANTDLSPDDSRLAVQRSDPETQVPHIWIYDLTRNVSTRLTFGKEPTIGPVWSPDGARVVYCVLTGDRWVVRSRRSSGVGPEETLFEAPVRTGFEIVDWSRDGRYLLGEMYPEGSRSDLVTLDLTAEKVTATPFVATPSNEHSGRFSKDGKWIAYMSDDSGQAEIYVQPFPPDGSRWQISNGGGSAPRWRVDSRELLYVGRARTVLSVPISTENGFQPGAPVPLTEIHTIDFVINSDAQRIIVSQQESGTPYPVVVATNWEAGR